MFAELTDELLDLQADEVGRDPLLADDNLCDGLPWWLQGICLANIGCCSSIYRLL
jgi:hypothetical protein